MFERLIRLCLAFAVAFVFAGQMEAAAAHCVRLAQAEEAAIAEAQPAPAEACHGESHEMAEPQQPHHGQPDQAPHDQAKHHKSGERCECVGVLTAYAAVAGAAASTHIEPYAWARPEAAVFASIEPAPALRPPRA